MTRRHEIGFERPAILIWREFTESDGTVGALLLIVWQPPSKPNVALVRASHKCHISNAFTSLFRRRALLIADSAWRHAAECDSVKEWAGVITFLPVRSSASS